MYRTLNPATGQLIRRYPEANWSQAESCLKKAGLAFQGWRHTSGDIRKHLVLRLAELLRQGQKDFAHMMTLEMGKPIAQSLKEIEKCVWGCEFYATHAEAYLQPEVISSGAAKSYVRYDPLGTILGIMPWNFPFWQVFRFAIPALMAGNTVLLKHAPNVPQSALKIESLFRAAGFPRGVFQVIFASNQTTARLIHSPIIQGVSLTGSDRAGSQVASVAGKALKKTVLELGGSDPFIVLEDASLEKAIAGALHARMLNTGQSCIAAKRILIEEKIFSPFQDAFVEKVKQLKVGDPLDSETDIGPLARKDLLQHLEKQVRQSVARGAKVLLGGKRPNRAGFFYEPTVLKNVRPGMPACDEEIFGPVAVLIKVKNEKEALRIANQTSYGLGASLWTNNLEKAESLASQIEAGSVFVNGVVKSDPRLPFGGIKRSGYGRELAAAGMKEFVNMKTVWIG